MAVNIEKKIKHSVHKPLEILFNLLDDNIVIN